MSLHGHPLGQQSQQPSQQPTQQPTHFPQTTPAGASIPMSANQFELLTAAYNATLSNQHIRADGEDYEPGISPNRRIAVFRLVREKIPFFVLSALLVCLLFWLTQRPGAVVATEVTPIKLRLANALVSYVG